MNKFILCLLYFSSLAHGRLVNGKPIGNNTARLRLNDPGQMTRNGQRLFEIADVMHLESKTVVKHVSFDSLKNLKVLWG